MRRRDFLLSLLAWAAVWAFWLLTTRDHHPTFPLALIVTTSLVVAYAVAVYLNHLVLLPWFWRSGRKGAYVAWLAVSMVVLTAAALTVIRISYAELWGPDADPNGVYKHFAIDLFGMGVHLVVAGGIVWAFRFVRSGRKPR